MVEASALEDYEIWLLITSILGGAVVGFFVAYAQDMAAKSLLYTGLVFALLFLISIGTALAKRARLRAKAKTIELTAVDAKQT